MRAPDSYPRYDAYPGHGHHFVCPATPTVYPVDDEVSEGLLGSDGKPVTQGRKRRHPIGFGLPESEHPDEPR